MLCQVSGSSMHPTLVDGDWVEVVPPTFTPGAILVARTDGGDLIVHRLLKVTQTPDGPRCLTRGDNTPACDPLWRVDQIAGQVGRVMRRQGDFRPAPTIPLTIKVRWAVRRLVGLLG